MDSLKGRRGGHFSSPPPLTPRIPYHTNGQPAVPGEEPHSPFLLLGVIELRVRFLGIRTKIHAAAVRGFAFANKSNQIYDSVRSPVSNSRVQLRGHMSEYPSYADIQTQRRLGVGTA